MHTFLRWGILGAALGMVADICLLYHPGGFYTDPAYQFLTDISYLRLLAGHYIGILAIPLELVGFYALYYHGFKNQQQSLVWFFVSAFILIVGVAYHATIGVIATVLREDPDVSHYFSSLKLFFKPLGILLMAGFLLLSMMMFYYIYSHKTIWPRNYAWVNPLLLYLFWIFIYFVFPPLGFVLVVSGFNLSILLFFCFYYFIR